MVYLHAYLWNVSRINRLPVDLFGTFVCKNTFQHKWVYTNGPICKLFVRGNAVKPLFDLGSDQLLFQALVMYYENLFITVESLLRQSN